MPHIADPCGRPTADNIVTCMSPKKGHGQSPSRDNISLSLPLHDEVVTISSAWRPWQDLNAGCPPPFTSLVYAMPVQGPCVCVGGGGGGGGFPLGTGTLAMARIITEGDTFCF